MTEDANDTGKLVRQVAEVNLAAQLAVQSRLIDESSAASRWVLATLVTINSGAMFAAFTSDAVGKSATVIAAGLFSAGIFWAIMLGYATILSAHKVLPSVHASADFWMNSLLREEIDAKELGVRQSAIINAAKPWRIASQTFGWLSLTCFFSGVIVVGCQLK